MSRERELDAHLHAIRSIDGSCPQCSDTKRTCANTIAQMEVDYRQALRRQPSVEEVEAVLRNMIYLQQIDTEHRVVGYEQAARKIASLYSGEGEG